MRTLLRPFWDQIKCIHDPFELLTSRVRPLLAWETSTQL